MRACSAVCERTVRGQLRRSDRSPRASRQALLVTPRVFTSLLEYSSCTGLTPAMPRARALASTGMCKSKAIFGQKAVASPPGPSPRDSSHLHLPSASHGRSRLRLLSDRPSRLGFQVHHPHTLSLAHVCAIFAPGVPPFPRYPPFAWCYNLRPTSSPISLIASRNLRTPISSPKISCCALG